MSDEIKFDVRLDSDALKEYNRLDNSVLVVVNKQIDELELRADEIGKPLENNNSTKLAGCREIKLRDAGIRIVYRITNEIVEVLRIVYVLTIEKRSRDSAFKIADKRNRSYKQLKNSERGKYLSNTPKWSDKKKSTKKKKNTNVNGDTTK